MDSPAVLTLGAVLAAAVLHATWHALLHRIQDKLVGFAVLSLGSLPLIVALAIWSAPPAVRSWPFLAVSAVLELGYAALLMRAYGLGEFGQVYPVARGTSPLLVAAFAAVFVDEHLALRQLSGMLLVSAGLAVLLGAGRQSTVDDRPALVAAVGAGVMIAIYTVVDGVGVRLSGSPIGYVAWLMLLYRPMFPLMALARRRRALLAQLGESWLPGLLAGMLSVAAYGLVLWAQTRSALAPVAALRETSVIFAAVIGTVVFDEPFGRRRIVASAVVGAGIVTLSLA